eukprot:7543937-Lingulodinium_polyedra.AAC.1
MGAMDTTGSSSPWYYVHCITMPGMFFQLPYFGSSELRVLPIEPVVRGRVSTRSHDVFSSSSRLLTTATRGRHTFPRAP